MNFFKLYIGDYLRDTGTLSVSEHGAYMLMLMQHYATEKPLPEGRALHRLIRAETKVEREAADAVLVRYWTKTEAGWVNNRAAREFVRAEEISATNREIAVRREAAKRARQEHGPSTKRAPSVHEPTTVGALTRHQTPDTNAYPLTSFEGAQSARGPEPPSGESPAAAPAVAACRALIAAGVPSAEVNAANPTLIALCECGATVEEFAAAGAKAKGRSNPFAYAIAVVKGQRDDAAKVTALPLRRGAHGGFAAKDYRDGINADGSFS